MKISKIIWVRFRGCSSNSGDRNLRPREPLGLQGARSTRGSRSRGPAPPDGLTLHRLLAKFFLIWALTDSWMFLLRAVSPAILKQRQRRLLRELLGSADAGAACRGKPPAAPFPRLAARLAGQGLPAACAPLRPCLHAQGPVRPPLRPRPPLPAPSTCALSGCGGAFAADLSARLAFF